MIEKPHLTVEDAARRDRLDRALATRAARWCAERVAMLAEHDKAAGRQPLAPSNAARDIADTYAGLVIQGVYIQGCDASDVLLVEYSWRHRALRAWADLEPVPFLYADGRPVHDVYDPAMTELEAADAALTWQLPSERIAR